jgi:predicted transcriptional regulator
MGRRSFTVRMRPQVVQALDHYARSQRRSRQQIIDLAVEEYLTSRNVLIATESFRITR